MTHLKYLVWNKIRWILHIKSFLVLTPVFACISTNSRTALDTDESRIGLVTFNVSQEWFIAQAMSFLSVLAYFIINNGPFKYCLTGMGSTALQLHAGGSSLGQGMNEKSCCCWRGGLTKGTPEPQLNPAWAKHRDLSTSPGFQPEATPYPPLPFLFEQQSHWIGSRRQVGGFSSRVKISALSDEAHPAWWQLFSIPPEFPQGHSRLGKKALKHLSAQTYTLKDISKSIAW